MNRDTQSSGTSHFPSSMAGSLAPTPIVEIDPVDLASLESFPASDPPAWNMGPDRPRDPAPQPAPEPTDVKSKGMICQIIDFTQARARRRGLATDIHNPVVRIYRIAPSPLQGGKARSRRWVVEFMPTVAPIIDPPMGWTAARALLRERRGET